MRDRKSFERDLDRALSIAARARSRFQELPPVAGTAQRLKAAVDLAEAIRRLMALREETANRLEALRRCDRSRRAYARAADLGTRERAGKP